MNPLEIKWPQGKLIKLNSFVGYKTKTVFVLNILCHATSVLHGFIPSYH